MATVVVARARALLRSSDPSAPDPKFRDTKLRVPNARKPTSMQIEVKKGGIASAIVAGSLAGIVCRITANRRGAEAFHRVDCLFIPRLSPSDRVTLDTLFISCE